MTQQMKSQYKTEIKTALPYCLYKIDGRFFDLVDMFQTKIRFTKIQTIPNRRTQSSSGIETIRDRWGIDYHSDVEIYTNKSFESDDRESEIWTLKIINDFTKKYRYLDRDAVHLVSLTAEDLFGFQVYSDGKGMISVALAGGITTADPLRTYEISTQLETYLKKKEEIPLWEELVLNAEQYLYQADYRHSVLESVIALEIVISNSVLKKCEEKGVSNNEAEKFIKDIGLTGNIKVTLKLLFGDEVLPPDDILEKCKGGITVRNNIVHKGKKIVTEMEATEILKNNKKLIQFLS